MNLTNEYWHRRGDRVYRRLEEASNNSRRIGWGEKNHDAVALLQQALDSAGFSIPHEHGFTGNYLGQTTAAVQRLQHDWGIAGQPGIAGQDVLNALDDWLDSNARVTTPPQSGAPSETFEFIVDGHRYRTDFSDLDEQLNLVVQGIYNRILTAIENRLAFMTYVPGHREPNGFVRMVSESLGSAALGGVHMPSERPLHFGMQACARAWRALSHFDHETAVREIGIALVFYHGFKAMWEDYIKGTDRGADRAITDLDWTSTIFLSAAAAYFTGGASAEIEGAGAILRPLIMRAGIGAGINASIIAVRELGVQATESFINMDPEFNWRLMASNIATAGVGGFVSSAVGGWLRPHLFGRVFPLSISEDVFASVNELLVMGGRQAMSREAFQLMLPRIAARVFTSVPQTLLADAARTAVARVGTNGPMDPFMEQFTKSLPRDLLVRAIAEAILGAAPPSLR